jgi:hypothetical protein
MSVLSVTVLNMPEDNLASLRNMVTEFAASQNLIVVPGNPHHDLRHEISIDPAALDLPGFLQLASTIGDGVLYLQAKPFDPDADDDLMTDEMAHLTSHKGQTEEVCVAFAHPPASSALMKFRVRRDPENQKALDAARPARGHTAEGGDGDD